MFSQFISSVKVTNQSPTSVTTSQIEEEKYVLSLAPFTPLPKICFENVLLGSTSTKSLTVRNPGCQPIEICITKVPIEQRLQLSWYEEVIGPQEDVLLEIMWYPESEGSWRDSITFHDGGRLKKDVAIIFKCITVKKKVKKPSKQKVRPKPAVISTKIRSPLRRHFSPTKKLSPTKKITSPTKFRKPLPDVTNQLYSSSSYFDVTTATGTSSATSSSNRTYTSTKENKENVFDTASSCSNKNNMRISNITFGLSESQLKSPTKNDCRQDHHEFNDSLEDPLNVSETIEEKLKRMAMTPISQNNLKIPRVCVLKPYDINIDDSINCTKFNISSSTQIKDVTINLSPKSTITNCPISPIRLSENSIHSETFEISHFKGKGAGLGLIVEESSNECYSAKTFTNNTVTKETKENYETKSVPQNIQKAKYTKTKSLNLKSFFEKSNINIQQETSMSTIPKEEVSVKLHDPEKLIRVNNPLLLTATKDIDPFMSSSLYFDTKWVDDQEKAFKKWLNALLTPPSELNSDANIKIDVSKLWKDCAKREVNKAPTKEVVSNKYHVKNRLDSLRKAAFNLITSSEINQVLSCVYSKIDSDRLQIRSDRDIHLDISLQAEIMLLFVSYNPLWLRIGLETIYGVTIPLHSNSDIMGLSVFISQHYFKDPYLLKKYKSPHAPKYCVELKKLILKKFLALVYFLDQAKTKQLIPHDPCLFSKHAPFKESREVVLKFSRDLLSAVGDITKYLRQFGYHLYHKQTYIHEFDYAITNLGVDLRDGVRLAKVMEIILLKDNLLQNVRVPAISRLQKIHNVKIAFDALEEADFKILHDIYPKDIVDGHKEKTLSFLWQIIYKFEAPRIKKAAQTIQNWWTSLTIIIKRRQLEKLRQKRINAAIKIQIWYRKIRLAKFYEYFIPIVKEIIVQRRLEIASTKIKSFLKMVIIRKKYLQLKSTMISIQAYSRRFLILKDLDRNRKAILRIQSFYKMYKQRKQFKSLKINVLKLENFYIAKKLMRNERRKYLQLKLTVIAVEEKYLANKSMRIQRDYYLKLVRATILVQQRFRANKLMLNERNRFLIIKKSAITVQKYYRANKTMKKVRNEYLETICALKKSVRFIEEKYLAKKLMIKDKNYYLELKRASIFVQRRFKANKLMKIQTNDYEDFRNKVVKIQRWFRNQILLKIQRNNYKKLIETVIFVQRKYKAKLTMRKEIEDFNRLKKATILIQSKFKANNERRKFINIKESATKIQLWYKSLKKMRKERNRYQKLIRSCKIIQRKYKAKLAMRKQIEDFNRLKKATILIQSKFKANQERKKFINIKESATKIQLWYKSLKKMREERNRYQNLIRSCKIIQRKYKAKLAMRKQIEEFNQLKKATILIQSKFKANQGRKRFIKLKENATKIQLWYRSLKKMHEERNRYQKLIKSSKIVQRKYRANLLMKQQLQEFKLKKLSIIKIQRFYRASIQMKIDRNYYLKLKHSVKVIEIRYKANLTMRKQKDEYQLLKAKVTFIQRKIRAKKAMLKLKNEFNLIKKSTIFIQNRYRSIKLMRSVRNDFLKLKNTIIFVQRKFRAKKLMVYARNDYEKLKKATITIQRKFRRFLQEFTPEKISEKRRRVLEEKAATKIQAFYRGYSTRNKYKNFTGLRKKLNVALHKWRPQNTLLARKEKALSILTLAGDCTTSEVNRALKILDYLSRISKEICIELSNTIPEYLYNTINLTTRSEPERESITYCTSILINFWKVEESREKSWNPDYLDTIITKMSHWCDKNNSLFVYLCTLLWLFAHNNKYKRIIKTVPHCQQRLTKIKIACERKQKMTSKVSSHTVVSYFGPYNGLPLPSLEPDWGIDYPNRPKFFKNAMHAIESLINILDF